MPVDQFCCPGCGAQVSVAAGPNGSVSITFTIATKVRTKGEGGITPTHWSGDDIGLAAQAEETRREADRIKDRVSRDVERHRTFKARGSGYL